MFLLRSYLLLNRLYGLFEVERIVQLARKHDTEILAKVIFSFSPDIILSPLALPRELLDRTINRLVVDLAPGALQDVLLELLKRPTFEQQWPEEYAAGLVRGKQRILQLEAVRQDALTLADILAADPEIKEWYDAIPT
jgi:hypothetical protein